ncbi:MAG: hypothetical protein GY861_03095 [bacterium]|nr:hypothetical protein [bacterium]
MKCKLCPIDEKPNEGKRKLFGVMACDECHDRVNKIGMKSTPSSLPPDKRTEAMKEDGAKNWANTLQPRRQGKPSREFIDRYPEESKKLFTKKEMLTAKNTWYDQKGAESWHKNPTQPVNPKALE